MHLLYRRYSRSGYAPPLFYAVMALAFVGVAIFGAVNGEWLILAIALVMVAVTIAGSVMMRRLSAAAEQSLQRIGAREDNDDR